MCFNEKQLKKDAKIKKIIDFITIGLEIISVIFSNTCILIPILTIILIPFISNLIKKYIFQKEYFISSPIKKIPTQQEICQDSQETLLGLVKIIKVLL